MTPNAFRQLALSFPGAVEAAHGGHPDFRAGKTIFATLGWPDTAWAMVKLTPDQQAMFIALGPKMFMPVKGGWGLRGATNVRLAAAVPAKVKSALATAWHNIAPKAPAAKAKPSGQPDRSGAAKSARMSEDRAFARGRAAAKAANLPGIEEGMSYGTASLKVRGKFLMRVKDAETLVFRCAIDEKTMLMDAAPDIYFETDHYKGWPAVLVRLANADAGELKACLERAWRLQAPAKLIAEHDRAAGPPARRPKQRSRKK